MVENVSSGVEVKTGNVANSLKRKVLFGKSSELHLVLYASTTEFG